MSEGNEEETTPKPYLELRQELERFVIAYRVRLARDVEPITLEAARQGIELLRWFDSTTEGK